MFYSTEKLIAKDDGSTAIASSAMPVRAMLLLIGKFDICLISLCDKRLFAVWKLINIDSILQVAFSDHSFS